MSRNSTESTASKTALVNVHREFNHFISWDSFTFIFKMGYTCIRQIVISINLVRGECGVRRIDNSILLTYLLNESLCMYLIRLFFNMLKVFCLSPFVFVRILRDYSGECHLPEYHLLCHPFWLNKLFAVCRGCAVYARQPKVAHIM